MSAPRKKKTKNIIRSAGVGQKEGTRLMRSKGDSLHGKAGMRGKKRVLK